MEEWKDIPGYEGYYQVSNLGSVRSLDITIWHSNRLPVYKKRGHIMTPQNHRLGYKKIFLQKNAETKGFYVHQLVLRAFKPTNNPNLEINHKNANKADNNLENLEWVTHSENMQHCFDLGLKIPNKGENHANSKFTNSQILEIRKLASEGNRTYIEIGKQFSSHPSTVRRIAIGQAWKHL